MMMEPSPDMRQKESTRDKMWPLVGNLSRSFKIWKVVREKQLDGQRKQDSQGMF